MSKVHVISSLTAGQDFHVYDKITEDQLKVGITPRILKTIRIQGGTGVVNRALVTPHGVVTSIDEEDLATLRQIDAFNQFEKNGYITVEKSDTAPAPEKFITEMETDVRSRPLTQAHFRDKEEGRPEILSVTQNSSGENFSAKPRKQRAAVSA